jgi:hypothetical protein
VVAPAGSGPPIAAPLSAGADLVLVCVLLIFPGEAHFHAG